MGTSGAYGGSGGRGWGKARRDADDFADDPTNANAEQLLNDIAEALDWDGDSPHPGDQAPPGEQLPDQPQRPDFGPLRPLTRGGGGDGPGGGSGGGGSGGAPAGGGGGGRSRARAANVGGSVAAAGLALRNRDEATLRAFGLNLAELDALDSHEQAKRILDAVGASVGDLQEEELTQASAAALLGLLEDEGATGVDAVRVFVVEYVFEVSLTEIGNELRDGTRDGWASVDTEDKLHDLIEARVAQVALPDDVSSDNIRSVVDRALDDARTYLMSTR